MAISVDVLNLVAFFSDASRSEKGINQVSQKSHDINGKEEAETFENFDNLESRLLGTIRKQFFSRIQTIRNYSHFSHA